MGVYVYTYNVHVGIEQAQKFIREHNKINMSSLIQE